MNVLTFQLVMQLVLSVSKVAIKKFNVDGRCPARSGRERYKSVEIPTSNCTSHPAKQPYTLSQGPASKFTALLSIPDSSPGKPGVHEHPHKSHVVLYKHAAINSVEGIHSAVYFT